MQKTSREDLKVSLEHTLKHHQRILSGILFLIGLSLRLVSIGQPPGLWQIVGELGSFVAAVIAIPFIYERWMKGADRQLLMADLEDLLDAKFITYRDNKSTPFFHEGGRMSIPEKVAFLEDAQSEIIEIGTSLRSFVGYFEQRPYNEFRKPIESLLEQGRNFKLALMDPDSEITIAYAHDRGEEKLIENIQYAIEKLCELKEEFEAAQLPGAFETYIYPHFPYCYMMLVDPDTPNGKVLVSHYLFTTKRADTPVIEVYKAVNPILFEQYHRVAKKLLASSKKI
jgi:hypothetical protein